jgi:hypothetical protein
LTAARRHLGPVALLVMITLGGLGFIITRPDGLMNVHLDLVAEHLGTQTIFRQLWQKERRVPTVAIGHAERWARADKSSVGLHPPTAPSIRVLQS